MSASRALSITARLILFVTPAIVVLWLVGALISGNILRHELSESFDRSEAEVARRLLPMMADALFDRDEHEPEVHQFGHFTGAGDRALVYQLRGANGNILAKSDDAPDTPLGSLQPNGFSDAGLYRVFTLSDDRRQQVIQVGELLAHRERALSGSSSALYLPLLLLVPVSIAAIWIGTELGLAPLAKLSTEIGQRGNVNLEPFPDDGVPSELRPISAALSGLVSRLRAALETERQFAASSAHELRTPIAAALAQTQRLLETTDDERALIEARRVEQSLRRLAGVSEKLLQLSRADSGMATTAEPTKVLSVLTLVLDELGTAARGRISLQVEPEADDFTMPIHLDALGIVLRNLVDNALKHSPEGSPVAITVEATNVRIANEGPTLTAADLERLRRRFERGPTSAGGSGLGLAIVDTILAQVGGTLTLSSPPEGQVAGLEAVVTGGVTD